MKNALIAGFETLFRYAAFMAVAAFVFPVVAFAQTAETGRTEPRTREAASSGGFYLRASALLDWSRETEFRDDGCSERHLYGCAASSKDGAPLRSVGDFGTIYGLELGLGYDTPAPGLRLEAVFGSRPDFSFEGNANYDIPDSDHPQPVSADLSSLSGLCVAYLDLNELGVPRFGPFGVFIGGGVGFSRIVIGETRMEFPGRKTIVPDGRKFNLAWLLTAGSSISLGKRMVLDVAWSYMDHGKVETGAGDGKVLSLDGGECVVCPLPLVETDADLKSHGLRMSLRYML